MDVVIRSSVEFQSRAGLLTYMTHELRPTMEPSATMSTLRESTCGVYPERIMTQVFHGGVGFFPVYGMRLTMMDL